MSDEQQISFIFSPEGFYPDTSGCMLPANLVQKWTDRGGFPALYAYGLDARPQGASPSAAFLYQVSAGFFRELTDIPELELVRGEVKVRLTEPLCRELLQSVPFTVGAEHVTETWLENIFARLNDIFAEEIAAYEGTVEMYLTEKNQDLRVPERIFFHLVENKEDELPFAFLATYATRDEEGKVKHMPLKYALTEYKGRREKLLELLSCLNRAAEVSDLIAGFMESGELFHPLRLTAEEAYRFLKQIEEIEKAGILCRIPNWWKRHAAAISLTVNLGEKQPSMLGFDTLVSMQPRLVVDGVPLTEADIRKLLAQTEGLALLKGKWVEVDHERLKKLLSRMEQAEGEVTLMEALRMGSGSAKQGPDVGALVTNGKWLSGLLMNLREPGKIRKQRVPSTVHAVLRPYQKEGYTWLNYMDRLGFGACLADDMGLGKTVQVLAYLEHLRKTKPDAAVLLVVPASLLRNWEKETEKFVPSMRYRILHGRGAAALGQEVLEERVFLTITTYGMAARIRELQEVSWECLILDEAQAIKNPVTNQTRAVKKLKSRMKIAMTGTPIENDLTNLWSLFDFLDKGLLGTFGEFRNFSKQLSAQLEGYAKLKSMISPFMLRRVKTDKRIISDLPDKLETVDYVEMSRKQVVLYRKAVADMEKKILHADGIERRGLVLATIMKLKQICNHPDQYLGQQAFSEKDSGKFQMLRELCETIYDKRERVLVFTQFREITEYLAEFLKGIFHADGYVLHGGTPVAKRGRIVEAFQGETYVPFIVLSVKAGGTGLNLTRANHVIHFDRWWNPAVENQATDRAFRIGQTKNVMVHKLACRGTIEEKIDALIESKKELAENVVGSSGEKWITELGNEELMSLLRLE